MDYRDIVLTLAEECMDKVKLDPDTTPQQAADVARDIADSVRMALQSKDMNLASDVVLELTVTALGRPEVSFSEDPASAGKEAAAAYLHIAEWWRKHGK